MNSDPVRRMSRDERRDQILDAATSVFAEFGYAGATTDQIARAAGVSQPYVVRLFGSKEELFERVVDDVVAAILGGFEAVAPGPGAKDEMVAAYSRFVTDPDRLRVLLHVFALGSDPVLGGRAREVLGRVLDLYRERTGGTLEEARQFTADGMLMTVLFAVRAPEHLDDYRMRSLVECYPAVAGLVASADGSATAERVEGVTGTGATR